MGHHADVHGGSRDLLVVKAKTFEGLVVKLLTVGIVRIVVVLISKSSGGFLQSRRRAGHPALGYVGPSRPA